MKALRDQGKSLRLDAVPPHDRRRPARTIEAVRRIVELWEEDDARRSPRISPAQMYRLDEGASGALSRSARYSNVRRHAACRNTRRRRRESPGISSTISSHGGMTLEPALDQPHQASDCPAFSGSGSPASGGTGISLSSSVRRSRTNFRTFSGTSLSATMICSRSPACSLT